MFNNIPTWVYILFAALVYLGIKRGFTSTRKVARLLVLPIVILIISAHGMFKFFPVIMPNIISYLLGIFIGCGLGFLHLKNTRVRADKRQGLIEIPGDWTYLILVMVIFALEFMIHYLLAINSMLLQKPMFTMALIFISGMVVGVTIGRNGLYFYKFIKAPHTDLILPKK